MKVYHMSDKLKLGDELKNDYSDTTSLALPFVQALEKSQDCFYAMVLNAKYLRAILLKCKLREWSNYVKWSVEGVFEYIRKTEFPQCCSRLHCNYFYDSIRQCKRFFEVDYGDESAEDRAKMHLYEIDLSDDTPDIFDMRLFDLAYDAMDENENITLVMDFARKYFSGECTEDPIREIISDKSAKAVRDISDVLYSDSY